MHQVLKSGIEMQTVLTKIIDDHEVIIGFDKPVFDPMSTRVRVNELMNQDSRAKDLYNGIQAEIDNINIVYSQVAKKPKRHWKKKKGIEDLKEYNKNIDNSNLKIQAYRSQIKEIFDDYWSHNQLYFDPKLGENFIHDEIAEELKGKLKTKRSDEVVLISGAFMKDHRDKEYWIKKDKWKLHKITKLGDVLPKKGIWAENISMEQRMEIQEQLDLERISKLSNDKRSRELEQQLQFLLKAAASKKLEYEVLEESDPLTKSRKWYQEEKTRLEERYAR